ncbi:uncharacterized protein MELLADRAFT_69142 [Melampsora larici-populina 98AG31]|uniref:Uncharacterized protein n=1 Tax=Melampsora larici-populina (strain 98AG31 / pathotype 3-4-7) TaxID=747676 RepID=F4S9J6_MELLP|nr:uncharacterized protein MELLADRAFT_69142 [Melampsora larici-populina 98AG31]EGF98649.1 hypothetical protein MELLADRAFT_69142 [Melampsora larici-populina 98AG31]
MIKKISISSTESTHQETFWNEVLVENGWNEIYQTNEDLKQKINQMISLRLLESYLPISLYKELQNDYDFEEIEKTLKSIKDSKQESSNTNFNEFIGLKPNSKPTTSTTTTKKKKVSSNENQPKLTGMKTLSSFWKPSSSSSKDTSKKQDEASK